MSKNFQSSLIPPGVPVPEPPGANLPAKIPIVVVGFILLIYLIYNISLEVIDWRNYFTQNDERIALIEYEGERESGNPSPMLGKFTHPISDDPRRCLLCHDLAEDTLEVVPGRFWGDQSCMICHPLQDFDRQHQGHKFEPFENCTACHSPHQSIEKPLLKDTYVKTCTLCHPFPGESK